MVHHAVSHAKISQVLHASPLFGALDPEVIEDLTKVLQLRGVHGGDAVIHERESAEEMMFVISGGLRVSRRSANGTRMLYNEIRPGMSFGEAGLILNQPRAADVTAVRDSTLAVLSRVDYLALLTRHPVAINQVFMRCLYNHLRHTEAVAERTHAQTFVVVPLHPDARAAEVAAGLTGAFAKIGRTHHLAPKSDLLQTDGGRNACAPSEQCPAADQDALEEGSDFLVYEAQATPTEWTLKAFRQADQVVFVVNAGASNVLGQLEQRLKERPDFALKRIHLAVLHPADAAAPIDAGEWRTGRTIERIYPLRSQHPGDYARLARFLKGTAVGVVLRWRGQRVCPRGRPARARGSRHCN
jgi:CRP-like cAMP-binding protein